MLAAVSNGSAVSTPRNEPTTAPHRCAADSVNAYDAGSAAASATTCEWTNTRAPVVTLSWVSTAFHPGGTAASVGLLSAVTCSDEHVTGLHPGGLRHDHRRRRVHRDRRRRRTAVTAGPLVGAAVIVTVFVAGALVPTEFVARSVTVYVPGAA